jgi:ATP-binding cassette subfamily B protein
MSKPNTTAAAITHVPHDSDYEADTRPLDFGLIRRMFQFARPYARKRNWLLMCVLLRAIQLPLLAWAIGAVINGPISRHDIRGTLLGAAAFLALAAITNFTFHFRQRLGLEFGESVIHDLRNAIFQHLQRMPIGFFHKTKLGRILGRVTSDAEAVRSGIQEVLFVSLVQGGQMVVAAALMLYYDWVLFLVVAGIAPVLLGLHRHFHRRFSTAVREGQWSMTRVTATIAESVSGIRVTQGFVRQEVNAGLFRRLVADHSRYNVDIARTAGVFLPLLELNSQFFIAALLLLGGYRALDPDIHMPLGNLIQFFFLANIFFAPIQSLGNMYNYALTAMAGAERVFKLLDTKPDWEDPPDALPLSDITGKVEFRNVTFGYGTDRPALYDISFVAEPGQTIALVGHTGSGKSSIVNLISKFYLPNEGTVLIDGRDLRTVQSESLHRQTAIVQQQNFLFSGTVLDNIRVGKPEATDGQVIEAARKLDCLDLFGAMPEGIRTSVGERGSGLSLGQRQLVCFTRAMLANPRILILDEATSSVDAMTEARLQAALAKLLKGRTSFVVAHRLSTIRHADLVLVLEKGRIIERGTHNELLARAGVYANLYRQFVRATEA